ncbi:hypothetical protein K525DRAFT_196943 [Schizophyllum commune Loenen D]|nr:hypothetical protein K525DRAFT_196943 [Schizophyllum commune Loenen D]
MSSTEKSKHSYTALLERPALPQDEVLRQTLFENGPSETPETLQNLVQEREKYIDAVNLAIGRLQEVISALSAQRAAASEELDICRQAAKSPIRRLPAELLVEIFHLAVNHGLQADKVAQGSEFIGSVLTITQVCRTWRSIAHGAPHLWEKITLRDMQAYGQRAVSNTVAWVQRAEPLPIAFTVAIADDLIPAWRSRYNHSPTSFPFTVFDRVESFPTHRIRELRLHMPALDMAFIGLPLSTSTEDSFPVLELLQLKVIHGDITHHSPLALYARSPLRTVDLQQPSGLDCRMIFFSWSTITNLSLNSLRGPISAFYAVLRECVALRRANIHFGRHLLLDTLGTPEHIILPQLCTLSMTCYGSISFRQDLQLPCLTSFVLEHEDDDDGLELSPALAAMLSHSPHLKEVALRRCDLDSLTGMVALLRLLPSVTSLSIALCQISLQEFYECLSIGENRPVYLPRLRRLSLTSNADLSEGGAGMRDAQLRAMLGSRHRPGKDSSVSRLESFEYTSSSYPLELFVLRDIIELSEEGMIVNV